MKVHSRTANRSLAALLATGLLGAFVLPAAEAPPRERPAERGAGAGPGAGGAGAAAGMRGAAMLDERQREVIREAAQPYREELRKLDEQLAAAQRELFKAMLAEKPEEKVMRAKAEAVAKIQVEQTLLRAKIVAAVVPTLKPEQREQLQTNPWMLNMLTGGLGMGMSGMRAPAVRTDAAPAREGQRDRPQP